MTLGNRIKKARERLGLTQDDIAEAMGTSKQAISNWEGDDDVPKGDKFPKLREVLKVEYLWLHDEVGPMDELTAPERIAVEALIAAMRRTSAA